MRPNILKNLKETAMNPDEALRIIRANLTDDELNTLARASEKLKANPVKRSMAFNMMKTL